MSLPFCSPIPHQAITAVLLAGGRGTRMGGVDKGLQTLNGMALAQHVLHRLRPQVSRVIISANRHLEHYAAWGTSIVPDIFPDFAGPLAGIAAALRISTTPYLLVAPCDMPFLPRNLAARLALGLVQASAQIAMVATPQIVGKASRHPVCALIATALATDLEAYLKSGAHTVSAWYARHTVIAVPFADAHAFCNINTLQALDNAHALH